jgi:hypothetical protein
MMVGMMHHSGPNKAAQALHQLCINSDSCLTDPAGAPTAFRRWSGGDVEKRRKGETVIADLPDYYFDYNYQNQDFKRPSS